MAEEIIPWSLTAESWVRNRDHHVRFLVKWQ